ncbi:MAG: response regulator transcription factor [Burkholderiales bacterium]|nr:response regulator transcription factor [Burkholderiales bacterium]
MNASDAAATVLIVEDDGVTRERLARVVAGDKSFLVLPPCAGVRDGTAALQEHRPRLLLVDLALLDGSGLELIRATATLSPETEALVITVFGDERNVLSAVEAGAIGYLLKDGDERTVSAALHEVLDGGSPISPSIARHLLRRFQSPAGTNPDTAPDAAPGGSATRDSTGGLTPREIEVLKLIAKGLSYADIATTLGMSANTVTSHVKHIYRKLAVRSRGEAVFEAAQLGLVRIEQLR